MVAQLPSIVTGVINGEEEAWSRACSLLGAYYQPDRTRRSAFDLIVNGDPYADDAVLSGVDVAALSALGISLSAGTARALLRDEYLTALAREIPDNLDLVDAEENVLGPTTAAATAWSYLASTDGYALGWKTAEAIVARLRPRLFPALSGRVRKALGLPKDMPTAWVEVRDALLRDDARLAYQLYYLIETAPVWNELSQVQILTSLIYADVRAQPKKKKPTQRLNDTGITTDAVRLR